MKTGLLTTLLVVLLPLLLHTGASSAQTQVEFTTADSIRVYADYFAPANDSTPLIILFHQAGANGRSEYRNIAPRLVDAGYGVLVVDQRSGGDRFGGTNRTVDALGGREFGYCDAMPDLRAAVTYAQMREPGHSLIVWGSSYSAGLVVRLAAEMPDQVQAVLAFSPAAGEPMEGCDPNPVADQVKQPMLVLRPRSEMQNESVAAQLARFDELGDQTYVAEHGVHGSSMLDDTRTEHSTDDVWAVVLTFLGTVN